MSAAALFWLACIGLAVTLVSATAAKVLQDFSFRDLKRYCRRRNRDDLFETILETHDQIAIGAETLQIVGTVLMLVAGGLWAYLLDGVVQQHSWSTFAGLAIVLLFLLLLATTWIPLAVAELWSAPMLYHTWPIWKIVNTCLWPLTLCARVVEALIRRLAGQPDDEEDEEEAFEEEVRTIVTAGMKDGHLDDDARDMIEGVIELSDVDVSDIMTPRSEVDAMAVDMPWEKVLDMVVASKRTRIPVYEKTLDNIVGILYVKDLLPELKDRNLDPLPDLRSLLRDPWFVPETNAVDELLDEFLHTRNHMAIVKDEYDAVAGVVTMEDALEEIVGEIVDESDEDEEDDIHIISDSIIEATGRTHLDELNERLGLNFPDPDDFDTIAGLVIQQLGYLPQAMEVIEANGVTITVTAANKRRIERVRLELHDEGRREAVREVP